MDNAKEENISIIRLYETNINKAQGNFINKELEKCDLPYKGIWSKNGSSKKKGNGVAIIVYKEWYKHLGYINFIHDHYCMEIQLLFRGASIHVFQLYLPPNHDEIQVNSQINSDLRKRLITLNKKDNTYIVVNGDANSVTDPLLDRIGNFRANKKPRQIIGIMDELNFIDSYRLFHPNQKAFTWHNNQSMNLIKSRIDYSWWSKLWMSNLLAANIISAEDITESDHSIVTALALTFNVIKGMSCYNQKKYNILRTIYDYKHAEANNWENLRNKVDDNLQLMGVLDILRHEELEIEKLNLVWDQIEAIIKMAIDNNIASIKIPKFDSNKADSKKYIPH